MFFINWYNDFKIKRYKNKFFTQFSKVPLTWELLIEALTLLETNAFADYTVKTGRAVIITSNYKTIMAYFDYITLLVNAAAVNKLSTIPVSELRKNKVTFTEFLTNDDNQTININYARRQLLQKITNLHSVIKNESDGQRRVYLIRHLDNILHDSYAVVEALLTVAKINAQSREKNTLFTGRSNKTS